MSQKSTSKRKKIKLSLFVKNLIIAVIILIVVVPIFLIWNSDDEIEKTYDWRIQNICDLATLECRFHNVGISKEDAGLFNWGSKEIWIEYDGTITAGIRADKVIIEDPTTNGVVRIHLPPVEILSEDVDQSTIELLVDDGTWFASVSGSDQIKVMEKSQKEMRKEAQTYTHIYDQARNNAKNILEQYVINVGKLTGNTYTVEWVEDEDVQQTTSATEETE